VHARGLDVSGGVVLVVVVHSWRVDAWRVDAGGVHAWGVDVSRRVLVGLVRAADAGGVDSRSLHAGCVDAGCVDVALGVLAAERSGAEADVVVGTHRALPVVLAVLG